ncbi:MAG: hypothetical protein HFJ09_05000 [Lachnospiraceae bacterium]|nr:hypothetical protein [Lachnospiraceae bacterium]
MKVLDLQGLSKHEKKKKKKIIKNYKKSVDIQKSTCYTKQVAWARAQVREAGTAVKSTHPADCTLIIKQ